MRLKCSACAHISIYLSTPEEYMEHLPLRDKSGESKQNGKWIKSLKIMIPFFVEGSLRARLRRLKKVFYW